MLSQRGFAPILILLAAAGIITFLLLSSTLPFKDKLFNTLFPKPPSHAQEPSVPDEILMKFKVGVSEQVKDNIRKAHGMEKKDEAKQIGVELDKVPEKAKDKIIEALKHNPRIEYAEPNLLAQLLDTPNDPYFNSTTAGWNLNKIGASQAWDISKGDPNVVVAVIDTGVFATHDDLLGKITAGFNFITSSTDVSDTYGHGTGVSGVVGATTNNGKGIAALARLSLIMPLKVVAPDGSISTYNIANAIMYGADHGAKAINMSLGSSSQSSTLQEAVNYAWTRGLVLTAAAGNDGTSGVYYPAAADNVIAVGATDSSDARWAGSSYGPQLDVVAPGVGIYSPNLTTTGYSNYGGTSYASPHVAALAALIMSVNPGLTNSQVVDIITSTALDLGDPGKDDYFGFGRIQADKALQKAINSSPAPTPTPTSSPTPTSIPTPSDTTPPTVSISSPTAGQTISGTVNISANAADNVAVLSVSIFIDGVFAGLSSSSPYSYSWDSTQYPNGSHIISAKALDSSNNLGESTTITVNTSNTTAPISTPSPTPSSTPTPTPTSIPAPLSSDTTPPVVSVSSLTNGSIMKVNSTAYIQASASDNIKISKVEFYVNGSLKCTSSVTPYTCSWKVPAKKNIIYTLSVKAYDSSNNTSSSSVTVKAQ